MIAFLTIGLPLAIGLHFEWSRKANRQPPLQIIPAAPPTTTTQPTSQR